LLNCLIGVWEEIEEIEIGKEKEKEKEKERIERIEREERNCLCLQLIVRNR